MLLALKLEDLDFLSGSLVLVSFAVLVLLVLWTVVIVRRFRAEQLASAGTA
jgi:hypothetical protein